MFARLKCNSTYLFEFFVYIAGTMFGFVSIVLLFFSWEELGITKLKEKVGLLIVVVIIAVIIAIGMVFGRKRKKLWGDHNKGVELCYGDINKIAFPKKESGKIVVIPVNRCFDTMYGKNLISPKSIHGQWIKNYIKSEEDQRRVDEAIRKDLFFRGIQKQNLTYTEKPDGKVERYQAGTVVEIEGEKGIKFYLLAISEFDDQLRAHCTEREFYEAIQGLMEYYDAYGQAEDLYCPVMGDRIIRPVRNTKDIIQLMLSVFKFNENRIHGKVHLVIYEKMKNEISLFDY